MRAFIAIELPERFRSTLLAAGDAVRKKDHSWRRDKWVVPENLHVTLKFLGELTPEAVAGVADVLASEIGRIRSFDLVTHEVRAVPDIRAARMLWAAFRDPDGEFGRLATAAERAAMAAGVPPDERALRPHATMVRARYPHSIRPEALVAANHALHLDTTPVSVVRATVFSSELTPNGPIYRSLYECRLADQ